MHWSHEKFIISWYRTMINAFLGIIQHLLTIVTIGWITKHMTFWYLIKCAKKDLKDKLKE